MPVVSTGITSIPRTGLRLISRSDRNNSPPPIIALAVLTAPIRRSGLSSRAGIKASEPFQRAKAASIGKMGKLTWDQTVASQVGGGLAFNRR
ncbi:hypothetical protein [Bradyrhizobium sp.]|uniref:hypothetical protein n=1 Tax=Bradyrhizobium sp. TaxID=376 RepID=UPI003C7340D0